MTKPTLPQGIIFQLYRGAIHGKTKKEKLQKISEQLDLFKSLGCTAVVMHGSVDRQHDLMDVNSFLELEALCDTKGLICIASFGLDSENPVLKGQKMGEVVAASKSKILILDMEGLWEDEASDKESAKLMGQEIRKLAPDALIIDQPWPIPTVHWSKFPWEETADYVDIRSPQLYVNNYRKTWGKDAYEKFWAWHEKSWAELDKRLIQKGKGKSVKIHTIQGYFWLSEDLINCLTKYDNSTLIVWCDWKPTDDTIFCINVMLKLKSLGFTGEFAVKNYQKSTNGKLVADNICGPKTLKELGMVPPTSPTN